LSTVGIEEKAKLVEVTERQNPFDNNLLVAVSIDLIEVKIPEQFLS
jgi:hypothetical protein